MKIVSEGGVTSPLPLPLPAMAEEAEKGGEVDYNTKPGTTSLLQLQGAQDLQIRGHVAHIPKKEQEEVTWTWKRQQLQGTTSAVSLYYKKGVLEDIRSVLTDVGGEKILQQFYNGCFGHLIQFIGGTSCSKVLHELVSHEIILPTAQKDELWFHISGTNIRFAPAEYALVTGLRFGSCSFDPLGSLEMPPDGVYERLCGGNPITIRELWRQFNSQDWCGSAEDYLKVAHILVMYLMGLGYDCRRKVEDWVWVLIEDLDLWNTFPWGAYTYQAFMHYVSNLPNTREGVGKRYHFSGPVWALQIWAYEAIPQLGKLCALVTENVTIPRCLKWSFLSSRRIDFVPFSEQELVCSMTLDPTYEEQCQPYWVSLQTPQPLGVRYATPWNPIKNPEGPAHGGEPVIRRVVASPMKAKVSLQQQRRSIRLISVQEASSAEPINNPVSTATPSACACCGRKCTWAPTHSSPSSESKNRRPQHVPEYPEAFNEARFVEQVSDRVFDRLIEPVAERMIEPVVKKVTEMVAETLIEPVSKMVTERMTEPVVERLSQQLIPHMKQWIEELFLQKRQSQSRSRHDPPRTPSLMREVHDQTVSIKTKKSKKKKKSRRSPSWSEETSDEGSESSSSGGKRREIKRTCKRKKPMYTESSSSESSESDRHRKGRNRPKHCPSSSSETSNSDDR